MEIGDSELVMEPRRREWSSSLERIVLRRTSSLVVAVVVLGAAAITAQAGASRSASARLYFLGSAGRTLVPAARTAPGPRAALAALIAGPSVSERAQGLLPALPAPVRLLGVTIAHGRALVKLRGATLQALTTISRLRVIASMTFTLTSLPTITRVRFVVNGRPWGIWDLQRRLIRDYSRRTLRPGVTACAPVHGCFTP